MTRRRPKLPRRAVFENAWETIRYSSTALRWGPRMQIGLSRGSEGKIAPLRWAPCHPSTRSRFKATMACSRGHLLTLGGHVIAENGDVTPSVICPHQGCRFHAFVRLSGWTFGLLD
jgi:hypothetical protein